MQPDTIAKSIGSHWSSGATPFGLTDFTIPASYTSSNVLMRHGFNFFSYSSTTHHSNILDQSK